MNLIDLTSYNPFLTSLYPHGLANPLMIGNINLEWGRRVYIDVHTKQKPAKEVKKWGVWGEDYDVVVIKLSCSRGDIVEIKNWHNVNYGTLKIDKGNDGFILNFKSASCEIKLSCDIFIFKNCSTYIDGGDDPAL
ncbi:hypothetical protein AwWohl_15020 [Gammaproteobacteria bacterium]|nr:hypothetical protein AwWohl_15020 [Gammaproteobacteria bacterium]